ncbi:pyridoxamine 5'-phosphate oxidase family protein [Aquipuribacter sp. SD81]|uniref:pyridoxamine 5'-phosphate oxidase family protein n=1 Tax=Aquipuribacter sp. SD81 TaxID=3127703 RepID=UPI00301732F0
MDDDSDDAPDLPDTSWGPGSGPDRRVSVLDRTACLQHLAGTGTGRVAFTDPDGSVEVLPVAFALDARHVVLRTSAGSLLERRAREGAVTFQADEADVLRRTGWSVMVRGAVDVRREPPGDARHLADALAPWAPGVRDVWIRIATERVTGRRIHPLDVADLRHHDVPVTWQVASRSWSTPYDGR